MEQKNRLPIHDVIPQIKDRLKNCPRLIIQAPPGAGKTTTIPLELIQESWCKKILILEPRRIAAKSAAYWMARSLGEKVGQRIGYTVHLDKKTSSETVIEVVTEGVFINRLLQNPELTGISAVIFDEFHERSMEADLGLALLKESQEILREDLRIIIMSATLHSDPISKYLNNAPVILSTGRSYPVELIYKGSAEKGLISHVVSSVIDSINTDTGSILVFLPGVGEIKRVESELKTRLPADIKVDPLYGALSAEEQERAIEPVAPGLRKVVLATSIAESSITIKGIRVVMDSGLIRLPRYNHKNGMERLETQDISLASADQRMGRAGRTEPGKCYRLWPNYKKLDSHREPGILSGDITPLVLTLTAFGYRKIEDIKWLTEPSTAQFSSSLSLLEDLGAVDKKGITEKGKSISRLPIHPRLGAMVYDAGKKSLKSIAALTAALLSERDILNYSRDSYQCDIEYRIEAVKRDKNRRISRVLEYAKSISTDSLPYAYSLGTILVSAFPDRIGKAIGNGRFSMANGNDAVLDEWDTLYNEKFLIIPASGGSGRDNRIFLAQRISLQEIMDSCRDRIKWVDSIEYDKTKNRFKGRRGLKLGHLTLKEEKVGSIPREGFMELLLTFFRKYGLQYLNWNKQTLNFQNRINFLYRLDNDRYPDLSDKALIESISWIKPYLGSMNLKNSLSEIPLLDALKGFFSWGELKEIDLMAPTHLKVPSGTNIPIDYSGTEPVLKVRLQELFGLIETPKLCRGNYALTIHLLSPASRPIQITRDLKSFWNKTYTDVKKDLKGRYPKHYWPDNPYSAQPTNRIKR